MATKPSDTLDWIATGKTTDPGVTLRTDGYDPGNRLRAQHLNFILKLLTSWIKYLSDQVFTGNVSATGNLTASTGIVTGLHVATGDADIKHGDRIVTFAGATLIPKRPGDDKASMIDAGVPGAWGQVANQAVTLYGSLPVQVGQRLKTITVYVKDTGAATITMKVYKCVYATRTQLGTTQTSSLGNADEPLTVTGLTQAVASGERYEVEILMNATTSSQTVYGGQFTVDRV